MANRGQLTPHVKNLMEKFLGRETDRDELRLIPYVHYLMVNEQKLDPNKINAADRAVWQKWKAAGYVEGGMTGMAVTKQFWAFMNEVLWPTYVAHEDQPDD